MTPESRKAFAAKKAKDLTSISERLVAKNREMQKALVEQSKGLGTTPSDKVQRIDEGRKGGDARTTRPTIKENVDPKPAPAAAGLDKTIGVMVAKSPEDIAIVMEDLV